MYISDSNRVCGIAIQWLWPHVVELPNIAAYAYVQACMWGALCDLRMAPPCACMALSKRGVGVEPTF